MVTHSALLNILPSCEQIICLDTEHLAIDRYPETNPIVNVQSHHLAYIIYTSGSTGKPKGVLTNHHNVVRLFTATASLYHFTERDVWTLFHSFAFDFSVWEIWGALFYGGRVVVVPYSVSRDSAAFYNLLVAYIVSHRHPIPKSGELRQFLKKQLPDYMVPSAFVFLDAFSLTPNGKVDRRAIRFG